MQRAVPYSRGFVIAEMEQRPTRDRAQTERSDADSRWWRGDARTNYLSAENSEDRHLQLDGIPMFNEDEREAPPSSVLKLKNRIPRAMLF